MSCNSRITLLDRLGAGSFGYHHVDTDSTECHIKALVIPSAAPSDAKKLPDYNVWVELSKITAHITDGYCSCPAGEVYKVSHNDTGALMALKVILVNDQESLASAESEARIMAECASPNVVTIFEHWQEDLPGNKKQLLLMELCFGSLRDLINDYGVNNLAIEIDTIRTLARDITKGLAFIHSKGIIHRDLKPENILLSSDGVAKISDFGLSTWHSDGSSHTARIGTRTYRSPEQLLGSSSYTQAVDCWALGCTIAELFYGGYLFDWDTNLALLSQMARILGPINRATMPGDIDVSMVDSIQPPAHFYLLDRLVATNRECADPSSPTESYERSVHCNTSSMASRPVLLATDQENDLLLSLCKLHNPGSDTKREEREKK